MRFSASEAAEVIERLGLEPIPVEGGLFAQTWRLVNTAPEHTDGTRAGEVLGTAIYGAITDDADSFSALHRLTATEIWHFYAGEPLQMLLLHPDGTHTEPILGPDILRDQHPQIVVPAGVWMGADLVDGGVFNLFGATMVPGFTEDAFEAGDRDELIAGWPQATDRITQLTRPGSDRRMPTESTR